MIQKLSDNVIKLIAAGEVIESPYSVIKELVENSIDANSNIIGIYLENGGMKSIRIHDNGDGIEKNDFYLLAKRYTTSKISSIDDLNTISSFGFRGEAIASISAVSKLEIVSCHKNSVDRTAFRAIYNGENLVDLDEYAHSQGTTITVKDLFYNIPARKKFIKNISTETRKIFDLIVKINILHPEISFSLNCDGKNIYSSFGHTEPKYIMLSLLKKISMKDNIIDISGIENNININGFISSDKFVLKRKKYQILSINGRIVENPELKKAIEQGYRKYIPKNLYPIYFININVPSEDLDVNCHPRKDIVRYTNEDDLEFYLTELISSLFREDIIEPKSTETNIFEDNNKTYNIIGQLKNSYIILEYNDVVYFLDQHALHERILYEHFKEELKNKENLSRLLSHTVIVRLTTQQLDDFLKKKDIFEQFGFEIDDFGEYDILVRCVPYLIVDNSPDEIREIVESMIDNNKPDWLDNLIKDLSCKSAIKSNTILTQEKIKEFIDFMIENKITNCPHGRPLFFTMSFNEIGRKFKRII